MINKNNSNSVIDTYGFIITVFHCPNCYKEHCADKKFEGKIICDNCNKELNVIKSR